jgi:hypothetical protein
MENSISPGKFQMKNLVSLGKFELKIAMNGKNTN